MAPGNIIRRLTSHRKNQKGDKPPPITTDTGETLHKAIEMLTKSTEEAMNRGTAKNISNRVESIWNCVFDIEHEVAPLRKFEMAEQLVSRPDVIRKLLLVFLNADVDVKRKIRDVLLLLKAWSSNDALESSVPRTDRSKQAKMSQLLYRCRSEVFNIIDEGRDGPESVGLYNDIIRVFARDHECLLAIFKDEGLSADGYRVRNDGCVWKLFDRILTVEDLRGFHLYTAFYDTVEMLFAPNQSIVNEFIINNMTRFKQTIHKLIAMKNFVIQARSLRFLYGILTSSTNYHIRSHWMTDPDLIKSICLSIQSDQKCVRKEAFALLNLFIQNPRNSPNIDTFIGDNRDLLLAYCLQNMPNTVYNGIRYDDLEENVLVEITEKLRRWEDRFQEAPAGRVVLPPPDLRDPNFENFEDDRRKEIPTLNRIANKNRQQKPIPLSTPMIFGSARRRSTLSQ